MRGPKELLLCVQSVHLCFHVVFKAMACSLAVGFVPISKKASKHTNLLSLFFFFQANCKANTGYQPKNVILCTLSLVGPLQHRAEE